MSLSEKAQESSVASERVAAAPAKVEEGTVTEIHGEDFVEILGYQPEMQRNRSMFTLLFQSLAIAAIPYGFGGPLISAIYGGGQLPMFLGWILVLVVDQCVAMSLAEFASRYPTSAGPYYWSYQLSQSKMRTFLSFVTGWTWLVGNWTITLSVNFGFASLLIATINLYLPDWTASAWQQLLIFYAICILAFAIVALGNRMLPSVDTFCAIFTLVSIFVTLICLSAKAGVGRHSVRDTLGFYDRSLSGWGGFSFFIGMLPSAYTFSAIGMISSMAEECADPAMKLPRAISLSVPVGGVAGLFFIIPICATLPPLDDILNAPVGQALPYIFGVVMGSPGGGLALTFLVLVITLFCSISITNAAPRCTWAFARDKAIPLSRLWSRVDTRLGVPIWALVLTTIVEMLLGLVNLGSSSAFLAFVSVGVISLAVSYAIPIAISLASGRRDIAHAPWRLPGAVGYTANVIALLWIAFETVLFSMPTVLPVTEVSMNYAIVVFAGFMVGSAIWYALYAHKVYKGPPASAGLVVE